MAFNLRRIRAQQGKSQEELAFKAGVDRSYISGIENKAFNPTLDVLDLLAGALSVDVSDLFDKPRGAWPEPLKAGRKPTKRNSRVR